MVSDRGLISILIRRCVIQGGFLSFICASIMCSLTYNRTRDIFDIIINFPDSMGAWNDLKVLIER